MADRRRTWVGMLVALVLVLGAARPVTADHGAIHGLDPADLDLAADPRVDFYRFANGGWLDRTFLPGDRASYGVFDALHDTTSTLVIDRLYQLAADGTLLPGSDEWKAVRLFQQGIDLATRNAAGIGPIQPTVAEIDAIADLDQFNRFLEDARFKGVFGLFLLEAAPDLQDSSLTAAYLVGPWYGMPNRDYYLEDDPANLAIRDAYVKTSAKLLGFLGQSPKDARDAARAVYTFERRLAETTLTLEQQQDLALLYHPTPVGRLGEIYPPMDWPGMLAAHGLTDVDQVIVTELGYLERLAAIVGDTGLDTLKNYLRLQLLWNFYNNLSEEIEATAYDFYGAALGGQRQLNPLDHRVLAQLNIAMGDAVGRLYVESAFPPEAKVQIAALTEGIVAAFRERLTRNTWMSAATREKALAKLAALEVKVGYPDVWRTYEAVEVTDSYAMSALSAINAELRWSFDQVGKPVDRARWELPPHMVTAYYNPGNNEIVFPAAILQPPFFDFQADPAVNFGGIGFVIAHEITHGFDLTGSQFDAEGNLANWWTAEDRARFDELNARLVAQYDGIEVLPGVLVDGQITVTENAADLGGLQVAYAALQRHLATHGRPPEESFGEPEFTQEQRFFIAAATIWREQIRDEALTTQVKSDPHAPSAVRGTQPLRNCDAFYAAFEIRPGDPMYLAPAARVVIW